MEELLALKLFNEKAALLRDSVFTQQSSHSDAGLTVSMGVDIPVTFTRIGPDDAAIREFVMTFRFFIQNNERCSIHKIATMYESLPVTDVQKDHIRDCREKVNEFLDRASYITLGTTPLTHRRIMDVFVYGNIAHSNTEKENVLESWRAVPGLYTTLYNEFVYVIGEVLRAIGFMFQINAEVLDTLKHLVPERKFVKPLP